MRNFIKLILKAVMKYWITIVGSLILVVSWYFEKVKISSHTDNILFLKSQRVSYEILSLHRTVDYLSSQLQLSSLNHDSNSIQKVDVMGAMVQELRTAESLRYLGASMQQSVNDDQSMAEKSFTTFRNNQNQLTALLDRQNMNEITEELKKQRLDEFYQVIGDQIEGNNKIVAEQNAIDKIQFITLLFYALGIVLLTIDRMKDAIYNNNDELKLLMAQVKEQNTKLLHRKDKEGKK